jgi:hypothetical protein
MLRQELLIKLQRSYYCGSKIKTDAVAAETAYGVAIKATNDVEFNESESFDGSNSHKAFFPHSEYFLL